MEHYFHIIEEWMNEWMLFKKEKNIGSAKNHVYLLGVLKECHDERNKMH